MEETNVTFSKPLVEAILTACATATDYWSEYSGHCFRALHVYASQAHESGLFEAPSFMTYVYKEDDDHCGYDTDCGPNFCCCHLCEITQIGQAGGCPSS